ncbi:amidohydrolase family protein [Microvirga antarctica]|uniref:amidohydrolase family protein n=1 Tax=Microvirga antarctica TaxID=2819233 RepID=UPI001B30F428|nr:amidohydrolase family protein [Microvirga antarctica]
MRKVTAIRSAAWTIAWSEAEGRHVYLQDADFVFDDSGAILSVGPVWTGPVDREIDGRRLFLMPGLINLHCHPSTETMRRGLTEEIGSPLLYGSTLFEYLSVWVSDVDAKVACAEAALCELLLSGCTTITDLSFPYVGWLDVLSRSGIRAVVAPMFKDATWTTANGHAVEYRWDLEQGRREFAAALAVLDEVAADQSGRLSGMLAPAQVDTCTPELLRDAMDEAVRRDLPLTLHISQSHTEFFEIVRRHGCTPIEWIEKLGLLGPRTILGHAVYVDSHSWINWPEQRDIARLGSSGTSVAHCPTVFSRRGAILQGMRSYLDAGVNVVIGTDTFPHNMAEELRLASTMARVAGRSVASLPSEELFGAATTRGARALKRDDIGKLVVGAKADFVLVDLDCPAMRPLREPLRNFIFEAGDRAVRDVFVDGRQLVENGKVLTLDQDDALARVEQGQQRAMVGTASKDWAGRDTDALAPMALPIRPIVS